MNISLDFDDTYTADPNMWNEFIGMCLDRGHDIRIVTFRKTNMTDPALDWLASKIPVIYTGFEQKRSFTENMGWKVDVWIDDSPEFIVNIPLLGHKY